LRREGTGSAPAFELGIYDLLANSPEEGVTASYFWEQLTANMLLHGKGYALIVRNPDTGAPERLEFVPTKHVKQLEYEGAPVYKIDGIEGVVFNDDVLCVPYLLGASPIELHAETIGLAKSAESYAAEYFNNGSIMTGVLSSDQPLKKEQLDIVRDSWNATSAGNLTRVLPAGFKYERIALSPDEAQNIEARKLSAQDIARVFNVPPALIGLDGNLTYSNTEQAGIFFAKHTILPIARRIEQEVEQKLLTPQQRGRYFVRFNIDELMRGDMKTRADYYNTLLQAGVLTPNEVRASENLPTAEGGDLLRVPVNVIAASKFEAYSEKISNESNANGQ
jgi:HK97 family phage portal protein